MLNHGEVVVLAEGQGLKGEIGQRLRDRRKQLGLTQEELAERADLSQNFIARVENGATGLGDASIIRLARSLEVSTDYLLTGAMSHSDCQRLEKLIEPLNAQELLGLEEIIKVYLRACGYEKWPSGF